MKSARRGGGRGGPCESRVSRGGGGGSGKKRRERERDQTRKRTGVVQLVCGVRRQQRVRVVHDVIHGTQRAQAVPVEGIDLLRGVVLRDLRLRGDHPVLVRGVHVPGGRARRRGVLVEVRVPRRGRGGPVRRVRRDEGEEGLASVQGRAHEVQAGVADDGGAVVRAAGEGRVREARGDAVAVVRAVHVARVGARAEEVAPAGGHLQRRAGGYTADGRVAELAHAARVQVLAEGARAVAGLLQRVGERAALEVRHRGVDVHAVVGGQHLPAGGGAGGVAQVMEVPASEQLGARGAADWRWWRGGGGEGGGRSAAPGQ